jgi:hypothetical protein
MGAEAVFFTPAVGLAILRVLALVLIPAVPLALVEGSTRVLGAGRIRLTPYIEYAALAIGVLTAPFLLIAASPDDILSLPAIFRPGGPWDLDFGQFLMWRVLPLLLSPFDLFYALVTGTASPDVTRGAILLSVAALIVIAGPAAVLRNRVGLVSSTRNLLLVLWGAYATVYTIAVLLWLANLLNFWCFLVLFALTLLIHD